MKYFFIFFGLLLLANPAFAGSEYLCKDKPDRSASMDCMANELEKLKQQLSAAEAKALIQARDDDKIAPIFDNEKILLASNKAFEVFRNAECERQSALILSGNLAGGFAQIHCEMDMTKARIAVLKKGD